MKSLTTRLLHRQTTWIVSVDSDYAWKLLPLISIHVVEEVSKLLPTLVHDLSNFASSQANSLTVSYQAVGFFGDSADTVSSCFAGDGAEFILNVQCQNGGRIILDAAEALEGAAPVSCIPNNVNAIACRQQFRPGFVDGQYTSMLGYMAIQFECQGATSDQLQAISQVAAVNVGCQAYGVAVIATYLFYLDRVQNRLVKSFTCLRDQISVAGTDVCVYADGCGFQSCFPVPLPVMTAVQRTPIPSAGVTPSPSPPACFAADALVSVKNKEEIPMHRLEIGDYVLTHTHGSSVKYSRVYSFGHRHENIVHEFLAISTPVSQEPILVTDNHLVFVAPGRAVPASNLQVGHPMVASNGNLTVVTAIERVIRKGLFAPFTFDGTIVVNGVLASTYATLQDDAEAVMVGPFEFSWHWLAHSYFAPHRVFCSKWFSQCQSESYNEHGMPMFLDMSIKLYDTLMQIHLLNSTLIPSLQVALASVCSSVDVMILFMKVGLVLAMIRWFSVVGKSSAKMP